MMDAHARGFWPRTAKDNQRMPLSTAANSSTLPKSKVVTRAAFTKRNIESSSIDASASAISTSFSSSSASSSSDAAQVGHTLYTSNRTQRIKEQSHPSSQGRYAARHGTGHMRNNRFYRKNDQKAASWHQPACSSRQDPALALPCHRSKVIAEDEPSQSTLPVANINKETSMSLSSVVCINMLDFEDQAEWGPREWIRSSLLRHVKTYFARRHMSISLNSISSCSASDTEGDDFSSCQESRDPASGRGTWSPGWTHWGEESSCSTSTSSSERSMDATSFSTSAHSVSSDETSSSESSSDASSVVEPPRQVVVPASTNDSSTKFTFALDSETRLQHCLVRNDFESAITICRNELQGRCCRQNTHRAETLSNLATLHMLIPYSSHSARLALSYSKEAYKLYQEEDRPLQVALSYIQIGLVYFWNMQSNQALQCWMKAMQMACVLMSSDQSYVAILLNNIGVLYYESGDHDAGLRALSESLNLQRQALRSCAPCGAETALHQLACTMGNLAVVFDEGKSLFDRARGLLQEAVALHGSVKTFPDDRTEQILAEYIENLCILEESHFGSSKTSKHRC